MFKLISGKWNAVADVNKQFFGNMEMEAMLYIQQSAACEAYYSGSPVFFSIFDHPHPARWETPVTLRCSSLDAFEFFFIRLD